MWLMRMVRVVEMMRMMRMLRRVHDKMDDVIWTRLISQ